MRLGEIRYTAETRRCPRKYWDQMDSADADVRTALAEDPETPSCVLRVLAADSNINVRLAVASNSAATWPVLKTLVEADEEDWDVLELVALHGAITERIARYIAHVGSYRVLENLRDNDKLSPRFRGRVERLLRQVLVWED